MFGIRVKSYHLAIADILSIRKTKSCEIAQRPYARRLYQCIPRQAAEEQKALRRLIDRDMRRAQPSDLREGGRRPETFRLPIKLSEAVAEVDAVGMLPHTPARVRGPGRLIPLDGTQYFSSQCIHLPVDP